MHVRPSSRRRAAVLLRGLAVVALAATAPLLAGCGSDCDAQAECLAKNGVAEASVETSGANTNLCGETIKFFRGYTGTEMVESGMVIWEQTHGDKWTCTCFYDTTDSPIRACEFETK